MSALFSYVAQKIFHKGPLHLAVNSQHAVSPALSNLFWLFRVSQILVTLVAYCKLPALTTCMHAYMLRSLATKLQTVCDVCDQMAELQPWTLDIGLIQTQTANAFKSRNIKPMYMHTQSHQPISQQKWNKACTSAPVSWMKKGHKLKWHPLKFQISFSISLLTMQLDHHDPLTIVG